MPDLSGLSILRKRLKLSDFATPNRPCGTSIQRAINEAWRQNRTLEIDVLPPGKSWITNRPLYVPGGWTDGTSYFGVRGRIVGEYWGEFNYNDDFKQNAAAGGLSGSIIEAGPSFPKSETVLTIGPANWGTVVEGIGVLGNNRAGRCIWNGSGRVTIRDVGLGDLSTGGASGGASAHSDGLGNWCLFGSPILTTGMGGTVIGKGSGPAPGEGFQFSHYENIRCSPSTNDTQLEINGIGGGFALTDNGGYYPAGCSIRSLYVATLRNKGGTNAQGIACLLRGCDGTSLHDFRSISVENSADDDSTYVGLAIDAANLRCSQLYFGPQPLTLSPGDGGGYIRLEDGAQSCIMSDVTIVFPSTGWSASMNVDGAGLLNVSGTARANIVRSIAVQSSGFLAASAVPDHLIRLGAAPSNGASVGNDYSLLVDGLVSNGLAFDGSSYAAAFGIHNNIGTHSVSGDGSDGETEWSDANGTARIRWRNLMNATS